MNPSAELGYFIVLEGIDASGSTTQSHRLCRFLERTGRKVLLTSEPSSGPSGMLIRLALARRLSGPNSDAPNGDETAPAFTPLDVHTLALLFAADRTDHLATEILPALKKGWDVVCDRYVLSSLAYQGLSLDTDWVFAINRSAVVPDLTIYLNVPVQHTKLRMRNSRIGTEIFDETSHQERVQQKYREVIAAGYTEVGPVRTVDASRKVRAVEKEIRHLVSELFTKGDERTQEELVLL